MPSRYEHQVHFLKNNHIQNLFIDESVTHKLPKTCFAFNVSSFLCELIQKCVNFGSQYQMESATGRIVNVLLDELALIEPTHCYIPISNHIQLEKVIQAFLTKPGDKRTIDDFANLACVSSRTLSRLFISELGMTFSDWRKQVRLFLALEKLAMGISVSQISDDLAYNSSSAFIELFRNEFGVSSGKYYTHKR